ncbi:MAG TPA: ADP-glyceromanno-heptose 6-epimerase [Oligoflexia bacterium]|nr:ADP-glyceromanno-heptose 6-epimerase [Oligoflexia bacterium]HMP27377.1 ADP-glyceromanno-heptose 6-epimerase [Oligoflexia bacterium]
MYIITGGAGFIGSYLAQFLNSQGIDQIIIVDKLEESARWKNLVGLKFYDFIDKDRFLELIDQDKLSFKTSTAKVGVFHLGANSSTTATNGDEVMLSNYEYSKRIAAWSLAKDYRFIYASSAATYGAGENGFLDDEKKLDSLRPTNLYGLSKHLFDLHAKQNGWLKKIAGLKFFNVYGPRESHKGRMASVAFHAYNQIKKEGLIKLFKSEKPEFADGEQKRDFVYVGDCAKVIWWLYENPQVHGIFNCAFGKARSWNDMAKALFAALDLPAKIEYIPMPDDLKGHYQYFTEGSIDKLRATGYRAPMTTLEDGIAKYVGEYLEKQ